MTALLEGLKNLQASFCFILADPMSRTQTTVAVQQGRNPEGAAFIRFREAFFRLYCRRRTTSRPIGPA
jgi:hypothetical protein